jgi:hypothetical protein
MDDVRRLEIMHTFLSSGRLPDEQDGPPGLPAPDARPGLAPMTILALAGASAATIGISIIRRKKGLRVVTHSSG